MMNIHFKYQYDTQVNLNFFYGYPKYDLFN